MNLLTYREFQKIAKFVDNSEQSKFDKFYQLSEETYIKDLIGSELVAKLKDEEYPELLPLIKKCIALKIEIMFVQIAPVTMTGDGGVTRRSDYSNQSSYPDKENALKSMYELLRSYEKQLIQQISEGDYEDWNKAEKVSKKEVFNIFGIG